jgi:hypothetical protein
MLSREPTTDNRRPEKMMTYRLVVRSDLGYRKVIPIGKRCSFGRALRLCEIERENGADSAIVVDPDGEYLVGVFPWNLSPDAVDAKRDSLISFANGTF